MLPDALRGFTLDGTWHLKPVAPDEEGPLTPEELSSAQKIPATVPGNVELDLLAAGKLSDPFRGSNVYDLLRFESYSWWMWREFDVSEIPLQHRPILVFEGIDCFADIWLNSVKVGSSGNMLIPHRFDVTESLLAGRNTVAVRIRSAVQEGRKHRMSPGEFAFDINTESLSVRKAPHMYGWDIMPRIVSAGLWRGVRVEFEPPTRFLTAYWATLDIKAGKVSVLADWEFSTQEIDFSGWQIVLRLRRNGKTHEITRPVLGTHGRFIWELEDIDLWWPRGYGEAALYEAEIELRNKGGTPLATRNDTIGIRIIRLDRTDLTDSEGTGEFAFVVNGEKIFAKGTNWVPLDAFHSRDPLHLGKALSLLADLNCNMVRCWGGNVYEDHPFFDWCDLNGVMVWQDFAMACGVYPQDDSFQNLLRNEAEVIITKLRNHPSLALWAGNNEGDEAHGWARTGLDPNLDRPTRETLPKVVRCLDPLRPFLPSSPYHSPAMHQAGDLNRRPEVHLWGPRGDYKSDYNTKTNAHFVSEIGYMGCPSRQSLEAFLDPEALWPWERNEQWITHSVRPIPGATQYDYRIPLLARHLGNLFDTVPDNLDDFILASQIAQAEALKFFIEFWRSAKGRRNGILWWNLRDGWSIFSDSVVDYYFRKKLAYHYIKRVQTDVCVMVREAESGMHSVVAVNDTRHEMRGTFSIHTFSGSSLLERKIELGANGIAALGSLPESQSPALWNIEWKIENQRGLNHYLAGPRPIPFSQYQTWLPTLVSPHLLKESCLKVSI